MSEEVTYKERSELTPKSELDGSEVVRITGLQTVTTQQIADMAKEPLRTLPLYYHGDGVPTLPTSAVTTLPEGWSTEDKVLVEITNNSPTILPESTEQEINETKGYILQGGVEYTHFFKSPANSNGILNLSFDLTKPSTLYIELWSNGDGLSGNASGSMFDYQIDASDMGSSTGFINAKDFGYTLENGLPPAPSRATMFFSEGSHTLWMWMDVGGGGGDDFTNDSDCYLTLKIRAVSSQAYYKTMAIYDSSTGQYTFGTIMTHNG